MRRVLVVNADDFGRTSGINRGIAEAHERGIVTSASLMVRWPAAVEASEYARTHPRLGLGLHVDLGEWEYVDGEWLTVYELEAGPPEVRRQLEEFRRLTGGDPSHLDSHQHVHREEPARSAVAELGRELGVPVRHFSAFRYESDFHGQDGVGGALPERIRPEGLMHIVRSLPAGGNELCCHPGYVDGLISSYLHEREQEIVALCDPRVRAVVDEENIELRSFRDGLV